MSRYKPARTTPKTNKALGTFLTVRREKKKLSIRAAALQVGIDYAVLNRIEKGTFRMSLPNAITFSEAYGFEMEEYKTRSVRDAAGKLI